MKTASTGSKKAMQAHWSRVHKGRQRPALPMSRAAELAAIARFEAERGVTACALADQIAALPQLAVPAKGTPMPGWR